MPQSDVSLLVGVLHHELKQAEACRRAVSAAQAAHDEELEHFFLDCARTGNRLQKRARELLRDRLDRDVVDEHDHEDAIIEEESMESFPASDPPATY